MTLTQTLHITIPAFMILFLSWGVMMFSGIYDSYHPSKRAKTIWVAASVSGFVSLLVVVSMMIYVGTMIR